MEPAIATAVPPAIAPIVPPAIPAIITVTITITDDRIHRDLQHNNPIVTNSKPTRTSLKAIFLNLIDI